ncbi:hypothetical protein [Nonomuraea turkmeniaca]|uniref:hypothetical protein n=1 Tax=Nonomuraea turkmeniaca TaxID=103838 RepID=UPI001FEAEF2E|nr:hypothetical protein [Nonomuraea turkmeniaca]
MHYHLRTLERHGLVELGLLALAAQLVRDVGALITGAANAQKRVATLAIDSEVRFASAADRATFAEELRTA